MIDEQTFYSAGMEIMSRAAIDTDEQPVQFTRVKPGETLIREEAAE